VPPGLEEVKGSSAEEESMEDVDWFPSEKMFKVLCH
jgi:hypothetical protein